MDKSTRSGRMLMIAGLLGFAATAYADYMSDAQKYYQSRDYPSAVIELKNLLQEDAKHAQARLLLGRTYLAQGNYAAAEKELRTAESLGVSPKVTTLPIANALLKQGKMEEVLELLESQEFTEPAAKSEALAIKGYLLLAQKDMEGAKAAFEQAVAEAESPFALLGRARFAVLEGRIDEGMADIEKSLSKDPDFIEALFVKGQLLSAQNKHQEAGEVYREVLEKQEQHFGARLALAETDIMLQQPEQARREVEKVLQKNTMHPAANFIMARLQLDAKQYEQAQLSAEKVLRIAPEHTMTFYILGAAHYAQGNFEQAKLYLKKFVALQPKNILAARVLGATYMQLGDPASAVELLAALDESQQHNDAQLLNLLGRAYLTNGEFDKGMEALNRAITLDPEIQGVRTQMALANLMAGKTSEAIEVLEQPGTEADEMTSIMLILSYIKQGKYDEAFAAVDKGIKSYPNNNQFPHLKGLVYEAKGDKKKARAAYQDTLKGNEQYVPVLLSLAKMDFAEGDYEKAKSRYLTALEASPGHLASQLAIARILEVQGNNDEMLEWVIKARDDNPNAVEPIEILTNYYLRNEMNDKALNEARNFQSDNPDNLRIWSVLARVHLVRGERGDAEFSLQKLIGRNEKDVVHRMQLAQLLADDKRVGEAMVLIDEVLALDQRNIAGLHAKTRLLIMGEKYDKAQQEISGIAQLFPDSPLAKQLTGDLLAAQGKSEQAIAEYELAYSQGKTAYLANILFQKYKEAGNLAIAAEKLAQYVTAVPGDYGARLRLASTYQSLNNNEQAKQQYELLAGQGSDNPVVLNNLAWLYWLEQDKRSLDYAQRAHEAAPDRPEIADTLGWVMLHLGDPKKALEIIREASSKAPTNPEIRYHLAVALDRNNDPEQAKKELIRLLRDYDGFSVEEQAGRLLEALNNR